MDCSFCDKADVEAKEIPNDILEKIKHFKLFDIDFESTKICDCCQNHFEAIIQMDEYIQKKQKDQEEMETKKAVEIYEQMKKTCPDFANALVTTERLEKAIKQAVDKQFKMKKQKNPSVSKMVTKKSVYSSKSNVRRLYSEQPSTSSQGQWYPGEWIEVFNTNIKKYECGKILRALGNDYFLVEIGGKGLRRNQRFFKKINS